MLADVVLANEGDHVVIRRLQVPVDLRGQGLGSHAMRLIIANHGNRPIELYAYPLDNAGLDAQKLVKWYAQFGFVVIGMIDGIARMRREATRKESTQ